MQTFTYEDSPEDVAAVAAVDAVHVLASAIAEYGGAVWVLAGGSSPMAAYKIIADEHQHSLDWSKVTALIGDERLVPLQDSDSNWGHISQVLFTGEKTSQITRLTPPIELPAREAASQYEQSLLALPAGSNGLPRLDLVWLGVGEDGHTLSLFPGHPDSRPTDALVVAVTDSPKPPATRISLTLTALTGAKHTVIFAVGAAKKEALARALDEKQLPIAQAAASAGQGGAMVSWLFDSAALSSTDGT